MDELLRRLELRIRILIDDYNQLQDAHLELNQGRFNLVRENGHLVKENETLLDRQEKTVATIKALVSKLKTAETWS
jgi:hypothetical protein